jgi:hypothetical protein
MKLLTKKIYEQLRKNDKLLVENDGDLSNVKPVVKIFTPDAAAIWLLTSIDDEDLAFGLCDLGMGFPELGYVSLKEIESVRGKLGLKPERDNFFVADKSIEEYARIASLNNRIIT